MSIKRVLPQLVIHSNVVLIHSFLCLYLQPVPMVIHSGRRAATSRGLNGPKMVFGFNTKHRAPEDSMKTSARNQFPGKVTAVNPGAVNVEIELDIGSGQKVVAVITRSSVVALGLKVGAQAVALIDASSVIVVPAEQRARFSARNQLAGEIVRLQPGAVNTDIVIQLPGGSSIASMVTNESSSELQLAPGKPVLAIFKASSVILGVEG
jgi:molybdopterin-binding protein